MDKCVGRGGEKHNTEQSLLFLFSFSSKEKQKKEFYFFKVASMKNILCHFIFGGFFFFFSIVKSGIFQKVEQFY